jgi:hypothetical protein
MLDCKRFQSLHTESNKELGSVGVGPRICHGKEQRFAVLDQEVLVGELVSIDRLASRAVVILDIDA